jgi:hypothetical protein
MCGRRRQKMKRLIKRASFCFRTTEGLTEDGRAIDLLPSLREPVSPIAVPD